MNTYKFLNKAPLPEVYLSSGVLFVEGNSERLFFERFEQFDINLSLTDFNWKILDLEGTGSLQYGLELATKLNIPWFAVLDFNALVAKTGKTGKANVQLKKSEVGKALRSTGKETKAKWWLEYSKKIRASFTKENKQREFYQSKLHSEEPQIFLWTVEDFHEVFNTLQIKWEMGNKLGKLRKNDLLNISKIDQIANKLASSRNEPSVKFSEMGKMLEALQKFIHKTR